MTRSHVREPFILLLQQRKTYENLRNEMYSGAGALTLGLIMMQVVRVHMLQISMNSMFAICVIFQLVLEVSCNAPKLRVRTSFHLAVMQKSNYSNNNTFRCAM